MSLSVSPVTGETTDRCASGILADCTPSSACGHSERTPTIAGKSVLEVSSTEIANNSYSDLVVLEFNDTLALVVSIH